MLDEGWYLMNTSELERELARWRGEHAAPSDAVRLSIEDALAYRDAGNIPDERGRTLRLVLHVSNRSELTYLQKKRLLYEPDFHDAPNWRRAGSKPVNVVPLRTGEIGEADERAWWDDPDLAALEDEWRRRGTVEGLRVPAAYRSFVYKTVLALRVAGKPVTTETVTGSIARWLGEDEVERIRKSFEQR